MRDRPPVMKMRYPLPFQSLSPADFERLCLWLVEREGYEGAEALGESGSEQGRDIIAWKGNRRVAFQCKRVQRFGPKDAEAEIDKIRKLPESEKPVEIVFIVTCAVSAKTRRASRVAWGDEETCHFWAGREVDQKVKSHPDLGEEFFQWSETGGWGVIGDHGIGITGDIAGSQVISGDQVTVNIYGSQAAVDEGARRLKPRPRYPDDESETLSVRLKELFQRRKDLLVAGEDTRLVQREILDVRRLLRKGPQLRAGEFLCDGRYELLELLGQGGIATVWKTWESEAERLVALKVLHGHHSEDRSHRERFFRGARKMAELAHPHIVRVYENEVEDDGWYFFTMEFVPGGTFELAVLAGSLTLKERLQILLEAGEALAHAHRAGVIHRDIKPSNILIDRKGRAKLSDFDLVRAEDTTGLTATQAMMGTVQFAAPEALVSAKEVGPAADIYSLGSAAVFAIYGERLPAGYYRDPGQTIGDLSCGPELQRVLKRATAFEPEVRFPSVAELCCSIEDCETSAPDSSRKSGAESSTMANDRDDPNDVSYWLVGKDHETLQEALIRHARDRWWISVSITLVIALVLIGRNFITPETSHKPETEATRAATSDFTDTYPTPKHETTAPSAEPQLGERSHPEYESQVVDFINKQRYNDAAAVAEELINKFPRQYNGYWLAFVAKEQWDAGDSAGAKSNCLRAIEVIEMEFKTLRTDDDRTAFVEDKAFMAYRLAVEILAQEGRVEDAFAYSERLRVLAQHRILGSPLRQEKDNVSLEMNEEERALIKRINELERQLRVDSPSGEEDAESELKRSRDKFALLRERRNFEALGTVAFTGSSPRRLNSLQQLLDTDTSLLAYSAGIDNFWVWIVEHESVKIESLPTTEEQLRSATGMIQQLRRWPGIRNDESFQYARYLYSEFITPVASHLQNENLVIIPHGLLHHVPFAALQNSATGRFLTEDFTLSLMPSATFYVQILETRRSEQSVDALVLGDPKTYLDPLPGARREAIELGESMSTMPLLGYLATETAVYELADSIGLLHLAAHGQYTPQNPIFSRIVLSADSQHDGRLEVHEIWDHLKLRNARLVTLSGCETALGEPTHGDEVIGLTQAFLVAGSRAVLSSLWAADDEASAVLMDAFYRRWLSGTPAAEALRGAQNELRRAQRWSAPYYWAGYTVTGDPRTRWGQAAGLSNSVSAP